MTAPPVPERAMLLAAGLGTRMQPLTFTTPKPLVCVDGRCLMNRALDSLEKAGVKTVVINVHHLAQQICDHVANQRRQRSLELIISDERKELLDSAGGVIKALPSLGEKPFFILNSDTFWQDAQESNLLRLAQHFDAQTMDMLLLTVSRQQAGGHQRGDFVADSKGGLKRAQADAADAVIYAGALMINPAVFAGASPGPVSLNAFFDRAIHRRRLFGLALEGQWYTVGTPDSLRAVEMRLQQQRAGQP